jgi:hypothetical protein
MASTTLGDLTNDDLLVQLDELCQEVGARFCSYLYGEHDRDTYAEAFSFASAVERAVECSTGASHQYTLYWSKRSLETLAADARLDNPKEQETFDDFLADHLELGAASKGQKGKAVVPFSAARLEFTDDDVHDALVEIHANDPDASYNFYASNVRQSLLERRDMLTKRDRKFDHSDLMLVVAALKRLEKAGRVKQEVRHVYGQRCSSHWHPAEMDASTGEAD